ncbi:RNA polymerase I enhancer binding protein [Coemansia sp. RSA 1199]|nr:RNA polymerase I enhancer binding protein [Coemansia sp. RSA 1199]
MSSAQTSRTTPDQKGRRTESAHRRISAGGSESRQVRLAYKQPQQQRHDEGEAEGAGLAALAELLRTYPGLLDGEVGGVARALTQATVAASKVAMQGSSTSSMGSLEKIRLGRSLSSAAAAHGRFRTSVSGGSSASGESGVAGRATAGSSSESGQHSEAGSGLRRRWFTQAHLRRLQSEGVVFRKGKFTDEENAEIDEAVTAFVEMHGLTRQEMYGHLFQRKAHEAGSQLQQRTQDAGSQLQPRTQDAGSEQQRRTQDAGQAGDDAGRQVRRAFWPELAEALPERPLQAIYHHVRRKFHPHNYQGAWTASEDTRLQRLVAAHGPAWEAISQEMGRMGTNCRDRWRHIQGGRSRQNVRAAAGGSNDAAAAEAGVTAPTWTGSSRHHGADISSQPNG